MYAYLLNQTKTSLKSIAKSSNEGNGGLKNETIYNILGQAAVEVSKCEVDWIALFDGAVVAFWQAPDMFCNPVKRATLAYAVNKCIASFGGTRGAKRKHIHREPNFLAIEYAQLMALVTDNEKARAALLKSGVDLTRHEQQRREGRDDFWSDFIAPLYNDPSVTVTFRICQILPECGVDESGVNHIARTQRSLTTVKEKFFSVRSHFTRSYNIWTVSGHNDPENVRSYVCSALH